MRDHVIIDGELVHKYWACPILDARRDGDWTGTISEGRRTWARQTYFYNCMVTCSCNNCNLAARPSPIAPHIRLGRADHANDVTEPEEFMRAMSERGIPTYRPAGAGTSRWESWHVETTNGDRDIKAYWKKHCDSDQYDTLPSHVERVVRKLFSRRKMVVSRERDRDKIDSKARPKEWLKRDKKVKRAKAARARSRKKVERMLRRARSDKTKRILREALKHG